MALVRKVRGTGKTKQRAIERAEQSDCYCGNKDGNNTILCNAVEGCYCYVHIDCEGLTDYDIGDIDLYACSGCLKMGLGETTSKGYNPGAEIPDDDVEAKAAVKVEDDDEDDEDDEQNPEYDDDATANDSADSVDFDAPNDFDSDSDDEHVSTRTRKRKADTQPVLELKVQKKIKLGAAVEEKYRSSTRSGARR